MPSVYHSYVGSKKPCAEAKERDTEPRQGYQALHLSKSSPECLLQPLIAKTEDCGHTVVKADVSFPGHMSVMETPHCEE